MFTVIVLKWDTLVYQYSHVYHRWIFDGNSVDPDLTAPCRNSLIWVCTICSYPSVPILRIITVIQNDFPKRGTQNMR